MQHRQAKVSGKLFLRIFLLTAGISLTQTLCLAGEDSSDLLRQGIALRMEGQNQKAGEVLAKIQPDSPVYTTALIHIGALLEDQGKPEDALRAYAAALEIDHFLPSARRSYDQLAASTVMAVRGKHSDAAREAFIAAGLEAAHQKDFNRSIEVFQLCRGLFPADPRPLFYSAIVRERQGRLQDAEVLYERTTEGFPEFAPAWVNYLIVLLTSGKSQKAARFSQKARDLFPRDLRVIHLERIATAGSPYTRTPVQNLPLDVTAKQPGRP